MTTNSTRSHHTSDLPIVNGSAYHLGIDANALAPAIIIVGDPERVDRIATEHLETIEVRVSHRGLTTCTGTVRETKQRVTVTTSGMGAPSIEIVLNEIIALAELDPKTCGRRSEAPPITIVRVGTCGALQPRTALGTSIISSHAVGLDSTAWFYAAGMAQDEMSRNLANVVKEAIEDRFSTEHPARGKIHPYGARGDEAVCEALRKAAEDLGVRYEMGATVTASGFFAPQGRDVGRIPASVVDLDRAIAVDDRFLNMDMETAFLLHFCGGCGVRAGALCVAVANRALDTFESDFARHMSDAVRVALRALAAMSK